MRMHYNLTEATMGLLDGLLGQVLGGAVRGGGRGGIPDLGELGGLGGMQSGRGSSGVGGIAMAAVVALALQLLQRNGGIEGVLGKLRKTGRAREADSWVGTGANEPISPDDLSDVFGRKEVDDVAREVGVDPQQALGGLASIFPEIVNQLTPQGRIESGSDDVVEQALRTLRERQGR